MTPFEAYKTSLKAGKRLPELEPIILRDAGCCFLYALNIIKGRWEKGEETITTNVHFAYRYAREVVKGRWKKGESVMITNAYCAYAYLYALDIIKGRWKEGEKIIAISANYSYCYAKDVLKWKIKNNKDFYVLAIKAWNKFPKRIKKSPDIMAAYFKAAILE